MYCHMNAFLCPNLQLFSVWQVNEYWIIIMQRTQHNIWAALYGLPFLRVYLHYQLYPAHSIELFIQAISIKIIIQAIKKLQANSKLLQTLEFDVNTMSMSDICTCSDVRSRLGAADFPYEYGFVIVVIIDQTDFWDCPLPRLQLLLLTFHKQLRHGWTWRQCQIWLFHPQSGETVI